jgi:hypothetical protein
VTTLGGLSLDAAIPVLDDDPRLIDARTPTAHAHNEYAAANHAHAGGSRFPQSITFGGYLVLTNVGAAYDAIAPARGLGMTEVDFTGCTRLDFTVRVNKVGTGTQSWQLWSETDSAQLAVIDDAAAAGDNKVLTVAVTSNLPTGVKRVRVRAKSTTAADDPVFYGSCLRLS